MVNITKSQPAPECLEAERAKKMVPIYAVM